MARYVILYTRGKDIDSKGFSGRRQAINWLKEQAAPIIAQDADGNLIYKRLTDTLDRAKVRASTWVEPRTSNGIARKPRQLKSEVAKEAFTEFRRLDRDRKPQGKRRRVNQSYEAKARRDNAKAGPVVQIGKV